MGGPCPRWTPSPAPDLFDEHDRRDVLADVDRYRRKLADPTSHAHQRGSACRAQFGGRVELDALLVRDVQNLNDPECCIFFKDWARSDRERIAGRRGLPGPLGLHHRVAARPAPLHPLGDRPTAAPRSAAWRPSSTEAESDRRRQVYGDDDRLIDPATGSRKPPRAGYDNADPWYDGRAHGFTIVDSPRSGTLLTAEEIEGIFVRFGGFS